MRATLLGWSGVASLVLATVASGEEGAVDQVRCYRHPKPQLTVLSADLTLPAGDWQMDAPETLKALRDVQLVPGRDELARRRGTRTRQVANQQRAQAAGTVLYQIYYPLREYDLQAGRPATLDALPEAVRKLFTTAPPQNDAGRHDTRDWDGDDDRPDAEAEVDSPAEQEALMIAAQEAEARAMATQAALKEAEAELAELQAKKADTKAAQAEVKRLRQEAAKATATLETMANRAAKAEARAKAALAQRGQPAAKPAPPPAEDAGQGPYFFLVPGVRYAYAKTEARPDPGTASKPEPWVIELRPYADDGQHYVLYHTGTVARVKIDPTLLARCGVKVTPRRVAAAAPPATATWSLNALLVPGTQGRVSVALREAATGRTLTVALDLGQAKDGTPPDFERWLSARVWNWAWLAQAAPGSALDTWVRDAEKIYGVQGDHDLFARRNGADERAETASMFNILGGRAAVTETLQLQALPAGNEDGGEEAVALAEIPGVEVKAHPYAELLKGQPGGRLPLAECVPPDRFLVYFANPAALANSLDAGSGFLFKSSSAVTANGADYDLQQRYLARLGLGSGWGKLFLQSQAVQEMAITVPDFFFLDGTDVTIILRVPQLKLIQPLFQVIGVTGLEKGGVVTRTLATGEKVFWAAREADKLLVLSTNEAELQRVLTLAQNGGADSLGRSAEFRYLLTRLPLTAKTTAYAYFSDPFIRRLVGPAVKIGQLRRLRARADLERLTAAALLFRADAQPGTPEVMRLAALGYVPEPLAAGNYTLDENLVAHSPVYGTPGALASLLAVPVARATAAEAQAYASYRENYTRFWRQFFDPIAVRVDDLGAGGYEIETFILPLLDSSIYEFAREAFPRAHAAPPLRVPELTPPPVLLASANIRDELWVKMTGGLMHAVEAMQLGFDPRVFDQLGPAIHLAILDGDPVVSLGSGDLLGAFNAASGEMGGMFGGRAEMLLVPVALCWFTRPVKILVEVRDPELVRQALRQATAQPVPQRHGRRDGLDVSFARVGDRDAWLGSIGIMGLIKLRLGVEVQGQYLVFSNVPWSTRCELRDPATVLNAAGLQANPGAASLQLPGLFAAASERLRTAAFESAGHLQALLLAGAASPEAAAAWHRQLYGFAPVHPGPGQFVWQQGQVRSTRFGSFTAQQQPDYQAGNRDFGFLRDLQRLSLSMQLEDEGLRTRCSWTVPPPAPPGPPAPPAPKP